MKTGLFFVPAMAVAALAGCCTAPELKPLALRVGTCNVRYDKRPGLDRYPTDHYLLSASVEL